MNISVLERWEIMKNNYDFHALLDDVEFEALAIDIVRVRENLEPNVFRRYPKGRDGGIDGYRYSDHTIIQAKCYKNDFNILKGSLKKEVLKLRNLKPSRYILVTSVGLNKEQQREIMDLFKGYIHSDEYIIGRIELNEYLADPKFSIIQLKYNNLWTPSTVVFEHILENIILRGPNNFNQFHLNEMKNNVEYYIKTKAYHESLDIMDSHNCLLVYGEPGIGKTMLGFNIAFHYLMQNEELDLFFTDTIEDVYKFYRSDKKQLFVVDDFLGVNYVNNQIQNGESKIYRMLKSIISGNNHKIVLISRKNILFEGMKLLQELKVIIQNMSVELSSTSLESSDKMRICWSILKKSNLQYSLLHSIVIVSDKIINHDNYNPRFINDAIHLLSKIKHDGMYPGKILLETLKNPNEIYERMYNHLHETSKSAVYLGICMAIFGYPVELNILRKCYGDLQESLLWQEWQSFDDALDQLSASFCFVRDMTFIRTLTGIDFEVKKTIVGFNNHSMMEYWRHLISKNLSLYGLNLIKSINLMNPILFFAHNLLLLNLIDEHNNMEFEQTIIPGIIDRIAKDYERLDFIYSNGLEEYCTDDRFTDFYFSSDYTDSYNLKLRQILDLNEQYNSQKLRDVIEKLKVFFINSLLKDDRHALSDEEKHGVPKIVNKLLKQGFEIPTMKELLDGYRSKINFLKFYIVFYEFRDIYGQDFDCYLQENYNEISDKIIWLIGDDYDFYASDDLEIEIENLLFGDAPEAIQLYNVQVKKESLKAMRILEKTLNWDGYSVKWNRIHSNFEETTNHNPDKSQVELHEDDIFVEETSKRDFMEELLPYIHRDDQDSWDSLINLAGIVGCEITIMDRVQEDLFMGKSKWKGTYYSTDPLFLAKIVDEYKRGNRIENQIRNFFDNMFSSIDCSEYEILTRVAVAAQEHNEMYFNRDNLKQWLNISNDEWNLIKESSYLGYNNGWLYFIASEIQVYLLCKNINDHSYNKVKILSLIDWIINESDFHIYIYNVFCILVEFFADESKNYFLESIQSFIEHMKELNGTEQLAFGLSSVYTLQEMNDKQEVSSTIENWTLLRFLEMLEVEFNEVTSDLSYDLFQKIATNKYETECAIDYEYCIAHPEKLAPLLNTSSVGQMIKDDLTKIDSFIEQYF